MPASKFKERLLQIMDQKHHWGWQKISSADLTKNQLLIHFQQEFEVYVRDFPVLLARVYGRMHHAEKNLKREFAENIYEEQTGGLSKKVSKGLSHPDLFLKMMRGLGFKDKDFENKELLPTSLAYRSYLDLVTLTYEWPVAAAVLTLFVEGSVNDRKVIQKKYAPTESLSQKLKNHSLHKYYGLKTSDMDLVKAHHEIEGSHRESAWESVLVSIPPHLEEATVRAMSNALDLWQLFRDGVCAEMGLESEEFKRLTQVPMRF